MAFRDTVNGYIEQIGCTTAQLATATGMSSATISRYRSGERTPAAGSEQIRALAEGIAALSAARGSEGDAAGSTPSPAPVPVLDAADVLEDLNAAASGIAVDYESFHANLTALLGALDLSNSDVAKALSFDPSYISRIIGGSRRPSNLAAFVSQIAELVGRRFGAEGRAGAVARIIGCDEHDIQTPSDCADAVTAWLSSNGQRADSPLGGFLRKVDEFDLDEFSRASGFDALKVPTLPFRLPTTKTYSGIEEFMEAELDFLKATALSKSRKRVLIYSDMPLDEMATDPDFPKKWAFGIAALLKKGLHLDVIHDVNRPLDEMIVGLEGWIPMYMTGQISPHYLVEPQGQVFLTNLKVSGAAALSGHAVAGHHSEGRYLLTKNRDDLRHYTLTAERMLEHTRPLMRIHRGEDLTSVEELVATFGCKHNRIRAILSGPPLHMLPDELLERILDDNVVAEGQRAGVRAHVESKRAWLERLLETCDVAIETGELAEEEFAEQPLSLALPSGLCDREVRYTHERYREHLASMRETATAHERLSIAIGGTQAFSNIQIVIAEGGWVLVSKLKAPAIHFVIEHPRMVHAFEHFVPAI